MLFENVRERVGIIERNCERVSGERGGNAGTVGQTKRGHAGARFHKQTVGVAVITAFKLDELVATGNAASESNGGHGRFSAAVDHAHHLDRRHGGDNLFGEFDLQFVRRAKAGAVRRNRRKRLNNFLVGVAQNHRSPGADVIDEAASINVSDRCAAGALDEQRRAADAAKSAHRRIDAAGDQTPARARRAEMICLDRFSEQPCA